MTSPSVFISYSHDSPEQENRVLELSDQLREDGIDANIDQYQIAPSEGWQLWMEKQIRDSKFVLLVCTEIYLRRVMKEDSGKGLGVMWESMIIYQYLYNSGVVNEKFIPVVFGRENTSYIPMPLQSSTYYDVSTDQGHELLYRHLTDQPYTIKPKLGVKKELAPKERKKEISEIIDKSKLMPKKGEEKILVELPKEDHVAERIKRLIAFGDYVKAIKECENILDANPDEPVANLLLAVATLKGRGADRYQTNTIKRLEKHLSNPL